MIVNELQGILKEQLLLAETTLNAIRELSVSLVEDNLSKIMRRNEDLETLAEKMQSLEEKRIPILTEVAKALDLEQELTLKQLASVTSLSEEFRQVAKDLWEKLQEIQEQNKLNEMLLKQSMYYNQKMQIALNQGSNYQPDGKLEHKKGSSLLDRSI